MQRAGVSGVKGHRKGTSGSGESGQTVNERAKVVDALREMRAEAYEASRPKANEYVTPKMDDLEKAKNKAIELRKQGAKFAAFLEYLTNRQIALPPEMRDAIEFWLETDDDRSLDQCIAEW